jgi:membrane-associated phospholipid phosphatase
MAYHWYLVLTMAVLAAMMMAVERAGLPVMLNLSFRGDIKRENRWFAQYGQTSCTVVAALLIWRLDRDRWPLAVPLVIAVMVAGLSSVGLKRVLGRVRPGHPGAGRFMGLSLESANWRESFPSSHTAAAASLTVSLCYLYPALTPVLWPLAIFCGLLRYLMDAHWPSDVLAGLAYGAAVTPLVWLLILSAMRHAGIAV